MSEFGRLSYLCATEIGLGPRCARCLPQLGALAVPRRKARTARAIATRAATKKRARSRRRLRALVERGAGLNEESDRSSA